MFGKVAYPLAKAPKPTHLLTLIDEQKALEARTLWRAGSVSNRSHTPVAHAPGSPQISCF